MAAPDEELSGGWVAHKTGLVGSAFIPAEGRRAILDEHTEIALTFRVQTSAEIRVGVWIALPTSYEQYLPQHIDRVLGQLGLAEKCDAYLVVTDNVPPMQCMFISQVRDELGDRHSSTCPRDDTVRVPHKHIRNQRSHSLLFNIETNQKTVMPNGLKWSLALFKATGLGNRVALEVRIEMPIDFHRNTGDMCGDLMGGPPVTGTDRVRISAADDL
jgi:hypothetical protein